MPVLKSVLTLLIATMVLMLAPAPDAAAGSVESAHRLVALLDLETRLERNIGEAIESARQTLLRRGVPGATVNQVTTALKAEMLASTPELLDEIIIIYAEEFSEQELTELIAFYETPTGQKYIRTQRTLNAKQSAAMGDWLRSVQQRALDRVNAAQV